MQLQAAPQEGWREITLPIRTDDHYRELPAAHDTVAHDRRTLVVGGEHGDLGLTLGQPDQFRNRVLAVLENVEQVVRQIYIALVQLVDQQDPGPVIRQQRGTQRAQMDIIPDIRRIVAGSGILHAADRVVEVQAVLERAA